MGSMLPKLSQPAAERSIDPDDRVAMPGGKTMQIIRESVASREAVDNYTSLLEF